MIALAVLSVAVAIYFGFRNTAGPDVRIPPMDIAASSSSALETTRAGAGEASPAAPSSPAGAEDDSPCVDVASGVDLSCEAMSAGLEVDSCDPAQVLAAWGVDAELESLLVQVTEVRGGCVAVPAEEAVAAGARASDLLAVTTGTITPALRECARTGGSPTVACAQPHEIEWVGPWRETAVGDARPICLGAAKTYTNYSFAGPDELTVEWLIAEQPDGSRIFRCALTVPGSSLQGTVRNISTDPLPLVQ